MAGETVKALVPITFIYKNRVGQALEAYLNGLSEKKILGIKCTDCNKVYVPPRTVCGICHKKLDRFVEMEQQGILENFTIAYVNIDNGEIKDSQQPYIIGMIRLNSADSLLSAVVKVTSIDKLMPGIKLKAVWKETTQGDYNDLAYFEPV